METRLYLHNDDSGSYTESDKPWVEKRISTPIGKHKETSALASRKANLQLEKYAFKPGNK